MLVTLRISPSSSPESALVFVVSRAVSRKSTVRNLLKRRAREIVRKNLKALGPGRDAFLIFAKNSEKLPFRALEAEILKALKKGGLAS